MQTKHSQPLYLQIKQHILEKINCGQWQSDMRIPSEADLGSLFSASRMTVNRALRELTSENRLIRKRGSGTFVARVKPQSALLEITSIADEIKARGGTHQCQIILLTEEKAKPSLASEIGLTPYAPVFHSIMLHKDKDVPIQLADRYIIPAIAPEYLQQDFTKITPNEYLLSRAPISHVQHVVEALIPDSWVRELLRINEAEPCLALHRTTWVSGLIATKSCFIYPGSRHSLGGAYTPASTGSIQVF